MPRERRQRKQQQPVEQVKNSLSANRLAQNSYYLYLLVGLNIFGLILIIIYYYYRNMQGDFQQARSEVQLEYPEFSTRNNFFKSIRNNDSPINSIHDNWVDSIHFAYHESFEVEDTNSKAINMEFFTQEIREQKKLLKQLPLTFINKLALSKTIIRFVPTDIVAKGMVTHKTGELWFAINNVVPTERRQVLLNEIYHLTVRYVNEKKLNRNVKISGKQLSYPFLNENGQISNPLKRKLKAALSELEANVINLEKLLKSNSLDPEDKRLRVLADYKPWVITEKLNKNEFIANIKSGEISITSEKMQGVMKVSLGDKIVWKVNDDTYCYGAIHRIDEDSIIVFCTLNKNNRPEELAKTFIKDYRARQHEIGYLYPSHYNNKQRRDFMENDFLTETASDIDMLLTSAMQQILAPAYKQYFEEYNNLGNDNEFLERNGYIP